ncbi:MAG: hypothetical protein RIE08_04005 [Acidimicrobiales bacterium]
MEVVDWGALAAHLGAQRTVSSEDARRALSLIVGVDAIRSAVDEYLAHGPGSELARTTLRLLRSPEASEYCMEQYRAAAHSERRLDAVELLRGTCGPEGLSCLEELLRDESDEVAYWAAHIITELAWGGWHDSDEYSDALSSAERHPSERVREVARDARKAIERMEGPL